MIKVVLVGAGNMALEHARAFAAVPGVTVVGVWSRTRARAEALAAQLNLPLVCDSLPELYERTHADLAVMAVLETGANAVAKACFAQPWAVLMEKPPGLHLEDARDIVAAAQAAQRRVWVGLNRRFLSSTRTVLADVGQREEARFIQVQDQQDLASLGAYNYPAAILENWMFANSIHLVDYLRVFGRGAIRRVNVVQAWNPRQPGPVIAQVEFSSGDIGLYSAVWNAPGPWMVTVTSAARRWELRPLEQAALQNRGERRLQPVEPAEWDRQFKPGFRLQAEHVIRAVRGEPAECPTLPDALATMELIHCLYAHA